MIHAGGLELANPLCLAPLAGITTLTVREFFSRLGAALTHTEMISCSGLVRYNAKTFDMLAVSESEAPLVVQLFASDSKTLCEGAVKVLDSCRRFAAFGVNMACPMPKITRNGSGAALLRRPDEASAMIRGLRALGLPVWVKIRKLDDVDETLRFIESVINAGADNVCIHGRTQAQRYEGVADRAIISLAARNFPGYISGSGDVKTLADVDEYLQMGCVCVMIARWAFANPWMFEEFRESRVRTSEQKLADLIQFAYHTRELSGEHRAVVLLKRFAGNMIKATQGAAGLRNLAMLSQNLEELINILREGARNHAC